MENGEMKHTVTIENRERIVINCVDDVESFNEEKVVVYTGMGVMIVSGYNFTVSYTHLDVYKRQSWFCSRSGRLYIWAACGERETRCTPQWLPQ